MGGRKKSETLYYNMSSEKDALDAAENIFKSISPAKQKAVTFGGASSYSLRGLMFGLGVLWRFGCSETLNPTAFNSVIQTKDFQNAGFRRYEQLAKSLAAAKLPSRELSMKLPPEQTGGNREASLLDFSNFSKETIKFLNTGRLNLNYILRDEQSEKLVFVTFAAATRAHLDKKGSSENHFKAAECLYLTIQEKYPVSLIEAYKILKDCLVPSGNSYQIPASLTEADKQTPTNVKTNSTVVSEKFVEYLPPKGKWRDRTNPTEHTKLAIEIYTHLASGLNETILALHGEVNAGKSGVVVEFLRYLKRISSSQNDLQFEINAEAGKVYLSVCQLNIRRYSSYELLVEILSFYTHGQNEWSSEGMERKAQIRDEFRFDAPDSLRNLRKEIRKLAKDCPCLFIFTNWDEQGSASPRSLLRDLPNAALVNLLVDCNTNTRIMLTTLGKLNDDQLDVFSSQFRPMKLVLIEEPKIDQMSRYFLHDSTSADITSLIAELHKQSRGKRVPGSHLLLAATCLQLADQTDGNDRPRFLNSVKEQLGAYCELLSGKDSTILDDSYVYDLIDLLVELLSELGYLHTILLIAASDDGIRPSSIERLPKIFEWTYLDEKWLISDETIQKLSELSKNFFVRKVTPGYSNRSQFEPAELIDVGENIHSSIVLQKQWTLNQTIREMLLNHLLEDGGADSTIADTAKHNEQLTRTAHSIMAAVSRYRANNWRRQASFSNMTHVWSDLLPDIQTYENLIASIDHSLLMDVGMCQEFIRGINSLAGQGAQIFAHPGQTHPAITLRYAVLHLLRSVIDRDHRLAMIYDRDGMRTRLHLLPFISLSRKDFRAVHMLRYEDLPSDINPALRNVFNDGELMAMLETISLSAFHSHCPSIIQWAQQRARDLLREAKPDEDKYKRLKLREGRIACCSVDMAILRGHPENNTDGSHEDTLATLRKFLNAHYGEYETKFKFNQNSKLSEIQSSEKVMGWLRLKVREAELLSLTGEIEAAICVYQGVREADKLLQSRRPAYGKMYEKSILSGRPARAAMKAILRSQTFNQCDDNNEIFEDRKQWLLQLLEVNEARLAQFGGAEQIAYLIDRGQYHFRLKAKHIDEIVLDSKVVRELMERSLVSPGMRLQAIRFCIAVELEALEQRDENSEAAEEVLRLLRDDVGALIKTAQSFGFKPMQGVGYFLLARIIKLALRLGFSKNESEDFQVFQEAKEKCYDLMIEEAKDSTVPKETLAGLECDDL